MSVSFTSVIFVSSLKHPSSDDPNDGCRLDHSVSECGTCLNRATQLKELYSVWCMLVCYWDLLAQYYKELLWHSLKVKIAVKNKI